MILVADEKNDTQQPMMTIDDNEQWRCSKSVEWVNFINIHPFQVHFLSVSLCLDQKQGLLSMLSVTQSQPSIFAGQMFGFVKQICG